MLEPGRRHLAMDARVAVDRLPGRAIGHELDADHQALAADFADIRVLAHAIDQRLLEIRADFRRVLDQALLLEYLEIGEADRAAHRMARIGEAVREHADLGRSVGEHAPHLVRHHDRRKREIGAGDALGERHQVGLQAVEAGAEPAAEAAEAGDDLIDDEQHVVLGEDRLHLLEIALGRHDHAAGAHDRLGDEGGAGLRPFLLDQRFELVRKACRKGFLALARLALAEVMRAGGVDRALDRDVERLVIERNAGEAAGRHADAVIGAHARDDLLLLRLAAQVVVVAHELELGVVGVGARAAEEHLAHLLGAGFLVQQAKQLLGQLDLRRVRRGTEGVEEAELGHFLGGGLAELGAAIADVHAPQARRAVDVALALGVDHAHARAAFDDQWSLDQMVGDRGHGVEHALLVQLLERQIAFLVERHGWVSSARVMG